jgi:S1-C subfamily serine protease
MGEGSGKRTEKGGWHILGSRSVIDATAPRGVAFLGVSPARASLSDGVRLGAVVPDGAAARAGMREGDIIVRLGEVPVGSFEELRATVQARRPGDPVRIVYLRDGEDRTAQAVLGERP